MERVLEARIRRRVEGEFGRTTRVQEGERNSRRDVRPETDGKEETGDTGQYGSGVVDLEKAFDTVPREKVMATLRWWEKELPGV